MPLLTHRRLPNQINQPEKSDLHLSACYDEGRMRALNTAVVLIFFGARAANAIDCLPGYVSIGCPPPGGAPRYAPASPAAPEAIDFFRQGVADWGDLKAWFDALSGDRRNGADYWAANRSVAGHNSCAEAATGDKAAFTAGCQEAKRRLDPIDEKRRSEPQYRAGFADEAKRSPIAPSSAFPVGLAAAVTSRNSAGTGPELAGPKLVVGLPPLPSAAALSPKASITQPAAYQPVAQPIKTEQGPFGLIALFSVIAITIVSIIAFVKRQQWKHKQRISARVAQTIADTVSLHSRALRRRRFQTLLHDPYGNLIWGPWEKEISYFVETVLAPAIRALGYEEYATFDAMRPYAVAVIDPLVQQEAERAGAISFGPNLTPSDFEHFCAEQLRLHGWSANTTRASGDQGSDVIAEKQGLRLVVQCKLYNHPVGNKAVQEVAAARAHERADYAVVVTNTRYTPSAQQLAVTNNVILLHYTDLQDIDKHLELEEADIKWPEQGVP
jgi:hypothetical protein